MIISRWYHIPTSVSLLVIVLVLVASVSFSLRQHPPRRHASSWSRNAAASRRAVTPPRGNLAPWRSSTRISSDFGRPSRSPTSCSSTSRCAGSGATGWGCARSTPSARPSFNVREETGRYKCFGCGAAGDVFTFVQEIEHVDFVTAVEQLAAKAGIQLRYTTGGESKDRQRRKQLDRGDGQGGRVVPPAPADRPGRARGPRLPAQPRSGRRRRPAVQARLGARRLGCAEPRRWVCRPTLLRDTGLAFTNKAGRLQDSFRARVMFPIFTENGEPVAFGGRILPGSTDPAKYKNSSETLHLREVEDAVRPELGQGRHRRRRPGDRVRGLHRRDRLPPRRACKRAVATCGTALTEEHVRMLKRYASRVVLAFDADAAGQGAAERFYEWEQKYQVQVSVAALPEGQGSGRAERQSIPAALRRSRRHGAAVPRLPAAAGAERPAAALARGAGAARRAGDGRGQRAPRHRTCASCTPARWPATPACRSTISWRSPRGAASRPIVRVDAAVGGSAAAENAEFVAVALLLQRWDDMAGWLDRGAVRRRCRPSGVPGRRRG